MEIKDCLQGLLREVIWYHHATVKLPVCLQKFGVAICLLVLVSRAAVIEIWVVHRPYVFRNLLQGQIYVLLIAVQVIFETIDFQIDLVNGTFDCLFLLLAIYLFLFLHLIICFFRIRYHSNCILISFLNLQLVTISDLAKGIRSLNGGWHHGSLLSLRELSLVHALMSNTKSIARSMSRSCIQNLCVRTVFVLVLLFGSVLLLQVVLRWHLRHLCWAFMGLVFWLCQQELLWTFVLHVLVVFISFYYKIWPMLADVFSVSFISCCSGFIFVWLSCHFLGCVFGTVASRESREGWVTSFVVGLPDGTLIVSSSSKVLFVWWSLKIWDCFLLLIQICHQALLVVIAFIIRYVLNHMVVLNHHRIISSFASCGFLQRLQRYFARLAWILLWIQSDLVPSLVADANSLLLVAAYLLLSLSSHPSLIIVW